MCLNSNTGNRGWHQFERPHDRRINSIYCDYQNYLYGLPLGDEEISYSLALTLTEKPFTSTTIRRSMSTELRNFLALTYEELEEKNLAVKEQRKNRVPADIIQEERIKVPHRREAHQGGHRALQRPRRPAAHAGLRQEVSGQEL